MAAVSDAQDRGEIDDSIEPELAASVLFSVFQAEVRHWISQRERSVDEGTARLMRALDLVVAGLRPAASRDERPRGTSRTRRSS